MNKKAYMRIIEAVIAIVVIMGAFLFISSNKFQDIDISKDVYEKQRQILDVIANDDSMRNEILSSSTNPKTDNPVVVNNFIVNNIPNTWDFKTTICRVDEICTPDNTPNDRDIYVSETIISASFDNYPNYNPNLPSGDNTLPSDGESKKLRFFVWRK